MHERGAVCTVVEGEVFDAAGRARISRRGVCADSGVGHMDRFGVTGLGGGARRGRHDVGDAALGQALPELGDLAVTGIGGQQRRPQTPTAGSSIISNAISHFGR